MNDELEDWLQADRATIAATGEEPRGLLKRLQYIAAINADAGPLTAGPQLLYRTAQGKVRTVPLGPELVVGREPPATLIIPDDLHLSRQHFRISQDAGAERVEDLHSRNGIFVNGEKVSTRVLCDGDIVEAGRQIFVFLRRLSVV